MPHVFWVVQLEFSKLVVFDVDGTLNQTERYAIAAYRKALEELGRDGFTDEELKQRIGAPFSEDLKFFFGADQKAGKLFFDKVSEYWFEGMEENGKAFPGTKEMLDCLKKMGFGTAICSNAYPEELHNILKVLEIEDKFDYIQALTEEGTKVKSLKRLLETCKPCLLYTSDAADE